MRETEQGLRECEAAMVGLEEAARALAAGREEGWRGEIGEMEERIAERRGRIEASRAEEEARRTRWAGVREGKGEERG